MKKFLKKRGVAITLMVVMIVLSVLIGLNTSFYSDRKAITDEYYQSSTGIQMQLDRRIEAANGLVSLARSQQVEESLIEQVEKDAETLRNANTPSEQFDANSALSGSFSGLADKLYSASEFTSAFEEAQQLIQESTYNQQAGQYNETLNSFPSILFRWAIFSQPLVEFR